MAAVTNFCNILASWAETWLGAYLAQGLLDSDSFLNPLNCVPGPLHRQFFYLKHFLCHLENSSSSPFEVSGYMSLSLKKPPLTPPPPVTHSRATRDHALCKFTTLVLVHSPSAFCTHCVLPEDWG